MVRVDVVPYTTSSVIDIKVSVVPQRARHERPE